MRPTGGAGTVEDDAALASVDASSLVSNLGQHQTSSNPNQNGSSTGNKHQIVIEPDMSGGMSDAACGQYKDCVGKFASALAREASRLEEAARAKELDMPEITATMVAKANDLLRNPPVGQASTRIPALLAQAVAFVGAMLTPIFGVTLHSYWQWTVAVTCGIIACAAQVYAIFSVRRR